MAGVPLQNVGGLACCNCTRSSQYRRPVSTISSYRKLHSQKLHGVRQVSKPACSFFPSSLANRSHRKFPSPCASSNDPNNSGDKLDDEDDDKPVSKLERFLTVATGLGGVNGSAAVLIAWYLHVDAFGNFHLNLNDILVGLECIVPCCILHAALMLPKIAPSNGLTYLRVKTEDDGSMSLVGAPLGAEGKEAEEKKPKKSDFKMLTDAVRLYQTQNTVMNISVGMEMITEFGIILIKNLANEMLYHAVLLTLLGFWIRDRLFEAGAEDFMFGSGYPTIESAKWLAMGVFCLVSIGRLVSKFQTTQNKKAVIVEKLQETIEAEKVADNLTGDTLAQVNDLVRVVQLSRVFQGLDAIMTEVGLCAGFILTGNLAASFVGGVVNETLFSLYQRRSLDQMLAPFEDSKEVQRQFEDKIQETKVRLLKRSVTEQLGEKPETSESPESLSNEPNGNGGDGNEDGERAVVTVNMNVLVTVLRAEKGRIEERIKREEMEVNMGGDDLRLEVLKQQRQEIVELLEKTEKAVESEKELVGKEDDKGP